MKFHVQTRGIVLLLLFSLLFLMPAFSQAQIVYNNVIQATSQQGEIFFTLNPFGPHPDIQFLFHSTDYGATAEIPNAFQDDSLKLVMYDRGMDLLIIKGWDNYSLFFSDSTYTFSWDRGVTCEEGPVMSGGATNIGPVSGEFYSGGWWSTDTLKTWREGTAGVPPRVVGWHSICGWSPGESWGMQWESTEGTIAKLYHCTDYNDNVEVHLSNIDLDYGGDLVRGYSPGEMYYLELEYDTEVYAVYQHIFCTTDTGRIWIDYGRIPFAFTLEYRIGFTHGWGPGELIAYYEQEYPYYDMNVEILYTQNYGQNWTFTDGFPYGTSVDEGSSREYLPASSLLTVWPNPTNGSVSFRTDLSRPARFVLYAINGREVWRGVLQPGANGNLRLDHLPSGIYLLTLPETGTSRRITLLK